YGSSGPGADISGRVPWAKKLNKKKLAAYSIEKVLAGDDGWNPVGAF
ncbi:MAG: pectin methylesterase, partial [Bacteroidales bacterium]|nr:pectin methylesterase [Bacteroidales bacterium]